MTIFLPVLLFALFAGVFASVMNEGLWSNAITLFNLVTAALLAMNFFEPLAGWFEKSLPSGAYFFDLIALWLIFAVTFGVLRTMTDFTSRIRVRFKKPVDVAGSIFFAAWIGWVTVCFAMATLHTAPLARNFMFLAFRPEDPMIYGLAPDRKWLGFTQRMSEGTFARMADENYPQGRIFDPRGEFMIKYASRREDYEKTSTFTGKE